MNRKFYILYCDYGVVCTLSGDYSWDSNINSLNYSRTEILKSNKNLKKCEIIEVFIGDKNIVYCDEQCLIPLIAQRAIFRDKDKTNYKLIKPIHE